MSKSSTEQLIIELINSWQPSLELVSPSALLPHTRQLAHYTDLLEKWGASINLYPKISTEDLISNQILDCAAAGLILKDITKNFSEVSLLDIGSGAGLPGIILAMTNPKWKLTLLEPREKRCFFLREAIRSLNLSNATVVTDRLKSYMQTKDKRITFNCIISRAVGLSEKEINKTLGSIDPNGIFAILSTELTNQAGERYSYKTPGNYNRTVVSRTKIQL